jgi:hypothetical protein
VTARWTQEVGQRGSKERPPMRARLMAVAVDGALLVTLVALSVGTDPRIVIAGEADGLGFHSHVSRPLSWLTSETGTSLGLSWGLNGISCATAAACTAVGDVVFGSTLSHGQVTTLVERRSGGAWLAQRSPTGLGGAPGSVLAAVSCISAGACMAVGRTSTSTLAEEWDGMTWRVVATPHRTGAVLQSISCTSSTDCTAVGSSSSGGGENSSPLAERWNGRHWVVQSTPSLAGTSLGELSGVSCTSSSACIAVGSNTLGESVLALGEEWNGRKWTVEAPPRQAGSSLSSISCTSASACTAVGFWHNGTLAERWNGKGWVFQPTPLVANTQDNQLQGVSCTSPKACTAVGSYLLGMRIYLARAEQWNGVTWALETLPSPSGVEVSSLHSVYLFSA